MVDSAQLSLDTLRKVTTGSIYEGKLYLVGGLVRDRAMGLAQTSHDIDIVLEDDALKLADFLYEAGATTIHPVVYPRFGTAMVLVDGAQVELVTARIESYAADSRKPDVVQPGTILDDARRRDFTINTLLENLHTGEVADPLGMAYKDLDAHLIRTPLDPNITFIDDPLRMLRAVRFASRFEFEIEKQTNAAIRENAHRLSIVSRERIRDEFTKMIAGPHPAKALEVLRTCGLLAYFAPELLEMVGVTQNTFHHLPVWEHTLAVLSSLPEDADLNLRLAALLHDIGKPRTRSVSPDGRIHFYDHQTVSAEMSRELLNRLKFSNNDIDEVVLLVAQHMRIGEYSEKWSTPAVRRLIRELGPHLDDLFVLHAADVAGLNPDHRDTLHSDALRERIESVGDIAAISQITSPLDGREIMEIFSIPAGREVGLIKKLLTDAVVDGKLQPDDREGALALARQTLKEHSR